MDLPAVIIFCSFGILVATFILLGFCKLSRRRKSLSMLSVSGIVWIAVTFFGEFLHGAGNASCSKILGCIDGFAGYDAFEHLYFGIAAALFIVWFSEYFPLHSLLSDKRWKNALAIIAMVALVSVIWEIFECAHDAIRLDVLHEHILNFRLHINMLDQPSNLDTMGDLTFSLFGAALTALFAAFRLKR